MCEHPCGLGSPVQGVVPAAGPGRLGSLAHPGPGPCAQLTQRDLPNPQQPFLWRPGELCPKQALFRSDLPLPWCPPACPQACLRAGMRCPPQPPEPGAGQEAPLITADRPGSRRHRLTPLWLCPTFSTLSGPCVLPGGAHGTETLMPRASWPGPGKVPRGGAGGGGQGGPWGPCILSRAHGALRSRVVLKPVSVPGKHVAQV